MPPTDRNASRAFGKALRAQVPRSAHAEWQPGPNRANPVDLLREADRERLKDLLPLRYARMAATPLAFLRGAAAVMARDLATTPTNGLLVQACGDAHLANFGAYGTPERRLVFDVNDFDETVPGPWEWDLKRLATSVILAGRANGLRPSASADAARASVRTYRQAVQRYAAAGYLAVWYAELTAAEILAAVPRADRAMTAQEFERAARHDQLGALAHLTHTVDGQLRFLERPPLVTHIPDDLTAANLAAFYAEYRASLRPDVRDLLERYRYVDAVRKVVGVGSIGTRCFVVLLVGRDARDPLFLQVKEARQSVLEAYVGASPLTSSGERVVDGQRRIQAASDSFLGWGEQAGVQYYVRQLRDMKGSVNLTGLRGGQLRVYASVCGWALARAHARSADAARLSSYIGRSDALDKAVTRFAERYADQTEHDHALFVAALEAGQLSSPA